MASQLAIYNASAGSGKTHAIAKQYIYLAISQYLKRKSLLEKADFKDFTTILATTFTNAAEDEMKQRILKALKDISVKGYESNFSDKKLFGADEEILKLAASKQLSAILHSYSMFSVTTIDSFVQRVIRSFAYEVHLSPYFKVELEVDNIVEDIVSQFLEKLEFDDELHGWLLSFLEEKIKNGNSINILNDIREFVKLLFSEDIKYILETNYNRTKYNRRILKTKVEQLRQEMERIEKQVEGIVQEVNKILEPYGDQFDKSNFFKFIKDSNKILDKFNKKIPSYLVKFVDSGKIKKNFEYPELEERLYPYAQQIYDLLQNERFRYNTIKVILKSIYLTGIMYDLYDTFVEFRRENAVYHISDFSILLKQLIAQSPVPFIYEKIGQWYKHILIDEFQDTSRLQWENFKPLVIEALAKGEQSIIVGDVKQSIYRWRGGDWKILLEDIWNDPELNVYELKAVNMNTNWRSFRNIVEFNNKFFSNISQVFDQTSMWKNLEESEQQLIQKTYSEQSVLQQVSERYKDFNGRVLIRFLDTKDDLQSLALLYLVREIKRLKQLGYKYSDITILVRRNTEAQDIVKYISELSAVGQVDFKVVSKESLVLSSSPAVMTIIYLIYYLETRDLSALKMSYINLLKVRGEDLDERILVQTAEELEQIFPPELIDYSLGKDNLYDYVEKVIDLLELRDYSAHWPYLQKFESFVLDFMYDNGSDFSAFLSMWEKMKDKLNVSALLGPDTVQVTTIHGAKGLSLPVVIIPFAWWKLNPKNGQVLWLKLDVQDKLFEGLPLVAVKYEKLLKDSFFKNDYERETLYNLMDNMNLLYVAFTRAVEQLIVFTKPSVKTNKEKDDRINEIITKLVNKLYSDKIKTDDNGYQYIEIGQEQEKILSEEGEDLDVSLLQIEEYPIYSWQDRTEIRYLWKEERVQQIEEVEQGLILHEIMSKVYYLDDLPEIIEQYKQQGILNREKAEFYKTLIVSMIQKAGVEDWFSENWKVYTEVSIQLPGSEEHRRPDRVIENGNELVIIDFKFAKPVSEHKRQVKEYIELYRKMRPDLHIKGYLLYSDGKLVEVK